MAWYLVKHRDSSDFTLPDYKYAVANTILLGLHLASTGENKSVASCHTSFLQICLYPTST
jgi:hypothetical protein